MKSHTLALFVAAAVTAVGLDLHAQSSQVGPAVKRPTSKITKSVTKIDTLEVRGGTLRDAVGSLKEQLEVQHFAPMNIILGQRSAELEVPELTLRNVTGGDALRLICTAANCEMEPIFSDPFTPAGRVEEYVIGYRVIAPASRNTSSFPGGYSAGGFAAPAKQATTARSAATGLFGGGGSAATTRSTPARKAPNHTYGSSGAGALGVVSGVAVSRAVTKPGGGTRLVTMGNAKPMLLTRVYALGRVTTKSKFPDVEKTLLATLSVAGHKPGETTLALHESTNVLVVRAKDDVHDLVSSLLESLVKNSDDAETGEVADFKRKLNALMMEQENLKRMTDRRIQESEQRRRQAEDELAALAKQLREQQKARRVSEK